MASKRKQPTRDKHEVDKHSKCMRTLSDERIATLETINAKLTAINDALQGSNQAYKTSLSVCKETIARLEAIIEMQNRIPALIQLVLDAPLLDDAGKIQRLRVMLAPRPQDA